MSGIASNTVDLLTRTNLWSRQIKDFFEDELIVANKFVDWVSEFPDGDTLNIPSVGQFNINNYLEDQPIRYTGLATGNWQLTVTDYKSAGTYITDKAKQDLFYAAQLEASFVPKMRRALAVEMETAVLAVPNAGQTASGLNNINGAPHRWVAPGASQLISVTDFALAQYSLKKANAPMTNLIAIVDPSVELTINSITNLTNVSNNPMWNGIIETGIAGSGLRFIRNIYGFDVYTSNYLPGGITETINAKTVTTNGVANYFFSAAGGEASPWKGVVRQSPRVESERNKDRQRDEYVLTARWGLGFYRPENLVTVLTNASNAATALL